MAVAEVLFSHLHQAHIMDWFPIVAGTFKVIVPCTGMFFAIKWPYEQGKKGKEMDKRAVLRAAGKVVAVSALALPGVGSSPSSSSGSSVWS
ncbi:hypothetical protein [Massilia litorea]|uniref:hypothetical protein n=1 Tax=Massilia litorea TaxID=2769491 RepID=UPI0027D9B4E2|nr:hypothetical protein [Massilia litorea]